LLLLVAIEVCAIPKPGIYEIYYGDRALTTPGIGDIVLLPYSESPGPGAMWELVHVDGKDQVYIRFPGSNLCLTYEEPRAFNYLRALRGEPRPWTLLETHEEDMFMIQSPTTIDGEHIFASRHPLPYRAGLDEPGSDYRKTWKFFYVSPAENYDLAINQPNQISLS